MVAMVENPEGIGPSATPNVAAPVEGGGARQAAEESDDDWEDAEPPAVLPEPPANRSAPARARVVTSAADPPPRRWDGTGRESKKWEARFHTGPKRHRGCRN
jgi:hypothetical protein